MHFVFLAILIFLTACNPVKRPPLLPLSPCKPSAKPKPPPCNPCPIYPIPGNASSLSDLVDIALHNHPLTKESWSAARASSASVTIAESAYYPLVDVDIEATKQRFSGFSSISQNAASPFQSAGNSTYYDIVLSVSYLLWDFGGRDNTVMSAKETLCSSSWNYSWTIQSVMLNVINSYWNTLGAEANVEAAKSDLKDAETLLRLTEAKKRAGLATYVDVAQAKANFVKAELHLVSAESQLTNEKASLATSMGLSPTAVILLKKPKPLEPTALSKDLERLLQKTRCCRADLTALKAAVKAQAYALAAQKANLYPKLSFSGVGGKVWYVGIGSNGMDYSATLDLNYALFTGFKTTGTIKQYEAELEERIAYYKNQELNALLNVTQSYTSTKTAIESYAYSKEYLTYAQDSFAANITGYKNGTKSIVDVITAETTLSDARSSLVESETNYFTSLANLAYQSGLLVSQEVAN